MYHTYVRPRTPNRQSPGFLEQGSTEQNSGKITCITMNSKYIATNSVTQSDPAKKPSESLSNNSCLIPHLHNHSIISNRALVPFSPSSLEHTAVHHPPRFQTPRIPSLRNLSFSTSLPQDTSLTLPSRSSTNTIYQKSLPVLRLPSSAIARPCVVTSPISNANQTSSVTSHAPSTSIPQPLQMPLETPRRVPNPLAYSLEQSGLHAREIPTASLTSNLGRAPAAPTYTAVTNTVKKKGKKYKPVALKVRPVLGVLPDQFRIVRTILGDPLEHLPTLDSHPPDFKACGRYTAERREIFDKLNAGFLLPEERKLLHYFMMLHQDAFAWNDTERGHFREDFFHPVDTVIPHTPWVQKNIPIPPGLYEEVCKVLQRKIDAGVLEPSNSSYRSRWFCVVKKDGRSLCIVQSLEPLNKVTIQHSGIPPFTEQLAEQFAARACGSMLDLYVGYDERGLAKSSRDYTTFQTPYGALRLTTLPMGWTNSVPIFHDDVVHILRPEIPHVTQPYIDDVPVRGPASRYLLPSGEEERIPDNSGIRRFVWEHFQDLIITASYNA